jgi:hypothetical protein
VGLSLYDQSKLLRQKLEEKRGRQLEEKDSQARTVFTKDHTNRIVEKMKV